MKKFTISIYFDNLDPYEAEGLLEVAEEAGITSGGISVEVDDIDDGAEIYKAVEAKYSDTTMATKDYNFVTNQLLTLDVDVEIN